MLLGPSVSFPSGENGTPKPNVDFEHGKVTVIGDDDAPRRAQPAAAAIESPLGEARLSRGDLVV